MNKRGSLSIKLKVSNTKITQMALGRANNSTESQQSLFKPSPISNLIAPYQSKF